MVRRLLSPEIDPNALAAVAADAANNQAQMAIDVAMAENAAAQAAAAHARKSHEGEMLRLSEEAIRAAEESARLSQEATRAAQEKAAADALAAEEARLREEALRAAQLAAEEAAKRAAQEAALNAESAEDIEIEEGETLEEVKARMASMKPKKQSISADLLNTANSYDDKVALIRMIMAEDSTRVAGVLKSLIEK